MQGFVIIRLGKKRQCQNRHIVHIRARNKGTNDLLRQLIAAAHYAVCKLDERRFLVFPHLKLHRYRHLRVFRHGPNVIHALNLVNECLHGTCDFRFDFVGICSGQKDADASCGHCDLRVFFARRRHYGPQSERECREHHKNREFRINKRRRHATGQCF